MTRIRGGCVFRNDGDGCLSSKYVNELSAPFGETCWLRPDSRNPNSIDPFEGTYDTVWLEISSVGGPINHVRATLVIEQANNGTYTLTWSGNNTSYRGVGMIYNNLLVCGYWN